MAKKPARSCVISMRFTAVEYGPLQEQIALSGSKSSNYMRDLVLSRSPVLESSSLDKKRMLTGYEKAGQALNQVAHSANSAPFKERLYLNKYVQWLNKLSSIHALLSAVVPAVQTPINLRKTSNGNRGSPATLDKKLPPISFRLTPDELEQFDILIRRAGCSLSSFFKELVLNTAPVFKEFTVLRKRLIFIVNKSGNNITQLAYIANSAFERGLIDESVQLKWLNMLMDIEELLLAGIDHAD